MWFDGGFTYTTAAITVLHCCYATAKQQLLNYYNQIQPIFGPHQTQS
jgi:hypothetical protein